MNSIKILSCLLLSAALFCASAPSAAAQSLSEQARVRLEKVMEQQDELTEEDVRIYLRHVDDLFRLRHEPDKLDETVRSIGNWTEKRFAYVTTKMAAGMALLMKPADPGNRSIPSFARPSASERNLIQRYQEQLEKAMADAQSRYPAAD